MNVIPRNPQEAELFTALQLQRENTSCPDCQTTGTLETVRAIATSRVMVHFVSTSCQRYVELEELALLLGRPTTVPGSDAMYQQLLKLTARLDEMSADSLQLRSDVRELKQVLEENTRLRAQNKAQAKLLTNYRPNCAKTINNPKMGHNNKSPKAEYNNSSNPP
jgi:regulator of replication initiation timing